MSLPKGDIEGYYMNKKLVAILCVALLVLSFASARIFNFGVGAMYGVSSGIIPTSEEGATYDEYKCSGLGMDIHTSLTFGRRAEIYFDQSLGIKESQPFSDALVATMGVTGFELDAVFDYRAHLGYEHAVLLDPLRLSVGVCGSLQVIIGNYIKGDRSAEYETINPTIVNMGVGLTAKAEFPMTRHLALYVKGEADYFTKSMYGVGNYHYPEPLETDGIPEDSILSMTTDKNFSAVVSAGLVVYF